MSTAWSPTEVALIVADYFAMYASELRQQPYNKTAHRRALAPLLNNRSDGSIERKHQNISAILIERNMPYISGYKPLSNYQTLLRESVEDHVLDHPDVERLVALDVEQAVDVPSTENILEMLEAAPVPSADRVQERGDKPYRTRTPRKVDYLARESRNAALGDAGERFVLNFERARLLKAGGNRLADRVERVSETRYRLCRVFDFRQRPRLFELPGSLKASCRLRAESFVARVG